MRDRLWLLAVLTLMLLSLAACPLGSTSSKSAEADQVAIYKAVVRQIYTKDHGLQEPPKFSFVYILGSTDDQGGGPGRPTIRSHNTTGDYSGHHHRGVGRSASRTHLG